MGAGKTTIAQLLSEKLNIKYIDIDSLIEEQEDMKISTIFQNKGEKYFRQQEKETIFLTVQPENLIISLGGGALENKETREFLFKNSTIIYLKTTPETIYKRIKDNTSRPLLCDNMSVEKIREILKIREKIYKSASITINTDNKTPEKIVEEITGVLND
uniref:Shikimate kinase n=1 Tax=uncultured Candidatus Melainabacteria bacterium TaxID=2682970 RepID=A0A650EIZ0_9BACT|nr:shikimate kinase [uncultured Candidatus Melainabacteria bacterium]